MTRQALALASLPIALAVAAAWAFTATSPAPIHDATSVVLGGTTVQLELATTSAARSRGLGGRDGLAPDTGMLFVFERDGMYAFWMKDMRFAIDILWLDAAGRVITIQNSVSPDTYPASFVPDAPARFVLELPAGFALVHGIAVGAVVALPAIARQAE